MSGHGAQLRGVTPHPHPVELQGEEHTTPGFEETGPSPLPLEELDLRGPEKGGESPTEGPCQHRTINQRGQCSVCGKELAEAPAPEKDLRAFTRAKMEGWDDRLTLNLTGEDLGSMAFRVTSEGRVMFSLDAPDGKAFASLLEFFNDITSRMSWGKIIEGE